jgi:hypothetical protein
MRISFLKMNFYPYRYLVDARTLSCCLSLLSYDKQIHVLGNIYSTRRSCHEIVRHIYGYLVGSRSSPGSRRAGFSATTTNYRNCSDPERIMNRIKKAAHKLQSFLKKFSSDPNKFCYTAKENSQKQCCGFGAVQ